MEVPHFRRIAAGDYETVNGQFRLYRLRDVCPPAWNVEDLKFDDREIATPTEDALIVDGAATKRDALALFADWYKDSRATFLRDWIDAHSRLIVIAGAELAELGAR